VTAELCSELIRYDTSARGPATMLRLLEENRESVSVPVAALPVPYPAPHHNRSMAGALGRTPPASRYSADMSRHAYLGSDPTVREAYRDYAERP
jgi:hypothetical protein